MMTDDSWTDRLSEYVDGELPEWERVALESHLESCAECSIVVSDLRRVVRRARTLKDRPPATDLWPGIASRIGATSAGSGNVVDLASRRRPARRWAFSLPQLAAAGIALMTASGGAVWLLRSPTAPVPVSAVPASPTESPPAVN